MPLQTELDAFQATICPVHNGDGRARSPCPQPMSSTATAGSCSPSSIRTIAGGGSRRPRSRLCTGSRSRRRRNLRCFHQAIHRGRPMIDLYCWTTPNGHKITIFLEEVALPYTIRRVNISKGEQFAFEFPAISPNNRIPAIVDRAQCDGCTTGGACLGRAEAGGLTTGRLAVRKRHVGRTNVHA